MDGTEKAAIEEAVDESARPKETECRDETVEPQRKFPLEDYIKLTDWETGNPIYLRRSEKVITEVKELAASDEYTARTKVNTKDNIYLVTESAYQVLCL